MGTERIDLRAFLAETLEATRPGDPRRKPGDTIPLGPGRMFRVVDVRLAKDGNGQPVLVVEDEPFRFRVAQSRSCCPCRPLRAQ